MRFGRNLAGAELMTAKAAGPWLPCTGTELIGSRGRQMIRQLYKKVSFVQIMVNTASSIAMIVDNIVIGRFLGVEAIGAYGVVAPLLLLIMAASQVLSTGGQMKCSEELGRRNTEKANGAAGLTLLIALIFSVLTVVICFLFHRGIASVLGVKAGTDLYDYTVQYLLGFIIGAPGFIGMLVLIPFIQLDGGKSSVIMATIGMTVIDCVGDVLAVTVFKGGMFGIGIASSLSYYCALVILILHFVKKSGVLKPDFRHIEFRNTGGIIASGIPAALQKVLRTLLSLTINYALLHMGGAVALGIFTVVNSIINLCNSVGQGMGASTLLLSGIFYAEEDKKSLKEVVSTFVRSSLVINLIMTVIVAVAARPLIVLFTKSGEVDIHQAAMALRIGIIDFVFFSLANCFKNYYQGINRRVLTYVLTVLEAFAFSAAVTVPLTMVFGVYGTCSVYAVGDMLTLAALYIIVCVKNKSAACRIDSFMMLDQKNFVSNENYYKKTISSIEDAETAACEVEEFVKAHGFGKDEGLPVKMSVCVEELCKNTIAYGFHSGKGESGKTGFLKAMAGSESHLEVSALFKDGKYVVRIRDDCAHYDPTAFYKAYENEHKVSLNEQYGLKIVFGVMKDNINYYGTLGLNSVVITA